MKLLIAYDGSRCAEAALDDLKRAGLPANGEAFILSVAEVWLPPAESANGSLTDDPYIRSLVERRREKGERALAEYEAYAHHAESRMRMLFPDWKITAEATYGSPAWELLAKADDLKPDLIVTGSQGQSALSRFLLGSVSQKVLSEARCSVRVARGKNEVDPSPIRLTIGFDGSRGARAAVDSVAARVWPDGTEAQLISVTDPISPTAIGRFVPPVNAAVEAVNEAETDWLTAQAADAIKDLAAANVTATHMIIPGAPKRVIVDEAEKWGADSIFVGANAFGSKLERFLLGSVSSAVAARAHCTVEVVR
ncbi:MAG: universal stress protein [Acidobacteria bacterium]|nr:universal stress protein [Acidobacteriota bacterium]